LNFDFYEHPRLNQLVIELLTYLSTEVIHLMWKTIIEKLVCTDDGYSLTKVTIQFGNIYFTESSHRNNFSQQIRQIQSGSFNLLWNKTGGSHSGYGINFQEIEGLVFQNVINPDDTFTIA